MRPDAGGDALADFDPNPEKLRQLRDQLKRQKPKLGRHQSRSRGLSKQAAFDSRTPPRWLGTETSADRRENFDKDSLVSCWPGLALLVPQEEFVAVGLLTGFQAFQNCLATSVLSLLKQFLHSDFRRVQLSSVNDL